MNDDEILMNNILINNTMKSNEDYQFSPESRTYRSIADLPVYEKEMNGRLWEQAWERERERQRERDRRDYEKYRYSPEAMKKPSWEEIAQKIMDVRRPDPMLLFDPEDIEKACFDHTRGKHGLYPIPSNCPFCYANVRP